MYAYHRRSYFHDTLFLRNTLESCLAKFLLIQFFCDLHPHQLVSGSAETLRSKERHGCGLPVQLLRQRLSLLPEQGREGEPRVEHGRGVKPRVRAEDE